MTNTPSANEIDALKTDIAGLRAQIAELAAHLKSTVGAAADPTNTESRADGKRAEPENESAWEELLKMFESSRTGGARIVRELATEAERHPIITIAAAFGIGFIVAKLMGRERRP